MCLPHAPGRNRVKLIRYRRRGRFNSTHIAVPDRCAQAPGAAALYRCISIPGNLGLPSSFAGFCPGWGVRRRRDARRGLRPHAMSLVRCLYNGCVIARCGFGDLAFDSVREGRAGGHRAACCGARTDSCGVNWNYSKIPNRNSILQRNFNHERVLFVQHPLEKGRTEVARSGSFVACAEVLGNCDQATEGGIPRSSRFRWFA